MVLQGSQREKKKREINDGRLAQGILYGFYAKAKKDRTGDKRNRRNRTTRVEVNVGGSIWGQGKDSSLK